MKQERKVLEENSNLIGRLKNDGLQFLTKEKHPVVQHSKKGMKRLFADLLKISHKTTENGMRQRIGKMTNSMLSFRDKPKEIGVTSK